MFQLLVTNPLDFLLFLPGQLLPDRLIHLDHTQSLGVVEHLHIFKPLEGIGQDIPLGLGVGVPALSVDAVGLFNHQPSGPASLVELPEVGNDITELHPTLVVGEQKHRLEKHRLVGVAHVHLPHHIQKQILAVGVVDERPAVLLRIFPERLLFWETSLGLWDASSSISMATFLPPFSIRISANRLFW